MGSFDMLACFLPSKWSVTMRTTIHRDIYIQQALQKCHVKTKLNTAANIAKRKILFKTWFSSLIFLSLLYTLKFQCALFSSAQMSSESFSMHFGKKNYILFIVYKTCCGMKIHFRLDSIEKNRKYVLRLEHFNFF